ncbi:tryptophan synthase beta chain 1-like [Juglans microcarpa x Juglans regia]|uniref:tryptophan synthase beta chain 1-like n=1 Tax=Juglans microcarpa x Juglans regia TaxID=2249226 RepID=UPI001B7E3A6C|nr:tryptophan synthase beta chain 1-like [Juglans microcarpa x Juglans regia]
MYMTACNMRSTEFLSTQIGPYMSSGYLSVKIRRNGNAKVVRAVAVDPSSTVVKEISGILRTTLTPITRVVETEKRKASTDDDDDGNDQGRFGRFGGKYVPETLMACLSQLESEFNSVLKDTEFEAELATALRDYVGRETPLYFAQRLTNRYKNSNGEGPHIYLKREDLNHGGAYKMNNAIAQAMIAKRLCRKTVVAAGAGQHGVATAAACAKLSLECTLFMGTKDMEKQSSNLHLMKLLGANVISVDGNFKDASSEAIRNWVGNLETSYYLSGTVVGPHPCPSMVREFQSVIGKETRRQAMEKWGGKPDVLLACVGSGSNALGLFHEFVKDKDVRLIGVEGAGFGLESGRHSATLARGDVGVYHGAMSYLLQDEEGQILEPYSIAVGLQYPGVGPELSFLKASGRAEFYTATDQEALDACQLSCRLEGIIPSLEASHALAFLNKLCPTLPSGTKVVVSCSGRGDKDVATLYNSNH